MKLIETIYRLLSQDATFDVDMAVSITGNDVLLVQRVYIQYTPTGDPNDYTEIESPTYRITECDAAGIHVFDPGGEEVYCDFLKAEGCDIWFDFDSLKHFLEQRLPVVNVRDLHYDRLALEQESMAEAMAEAL